MVYDKENGFENINDQRTRGAQKKKGPTFQTKVIPFHFPFLIANNISTHKWSKRSMFEYPTKKIYFLKVKIHHVWTGETWPKVAVILWYQ